MRNLNRIFAILVTVVLVSCGNNQKEEEEKITIGDNNQIESTETSEGTTQTTDADNMTNEEGVVEVSITGNDQMQFNKNELKVKAGQTVRLTLHHSGQLAENVMGHNVVILSQGTDVTDFAQRAAAARDNEYIPADSDDEVIAHTELIGGGETTTVEFEAPEAGTYTFICSFPGHYVQMQGKLIVE